MMELGRVQEGVMLGRLGLLRRALNLELGWTGTVTVTLVLLLGLASDGATQVFGPPAALNTNAAIDSRADIAPQVTTDGAGHWVAVWHSDDTLGGTIGPDVDTLVARSTDNGATWTAPTALNTNAATDSGHDMWPEVTTDGAGNWMAVWHSNNSLGDTIGTDWDILVARSTDYGATWTAPTALNTNAPTDSGTDSFPRLTTDGAGEWVAVWYSRDSLGGTIGTDHDILVARSPDNGATWTAPTALNTNAPTDSGPDYYPQVTTDGAGNWVAVWVSTDCLGDTIDTDEDILVARSTDNGVTWTAPATLNTNAATDSGYDSWPEVTTDGAGNWVAVWQSDDSLGGTIDTDEDILVARSTNNGATWTVPTALNTSASTDSGDDFLPLVTTDGAGNWVAVWDSRDSFGGTIGTDVDILVARSTDSGATWTVPVILNTNAGTDFGDDWSGQVTTDGAGNWVVAWTSYDSLGGTIGTDRDILVAISSSLFCGDGQLDPGEECDDGDTEPCDGCSATCTLEEACACMGGDTDEDTLCDDEDPCKHYANTLPLVISGFSGIPDECLCGDFDGDGFHSATDAAAINDCAAFIGFDCVSERDEVTDPCAGGVCINDGFYSAMDADLVNRVAAFFDPAYTLQCGLRPEGTCGGMTGVSCGFAPCIDNAECGLLEYCRKPRGGCSAEGGCRARPRGCFEILAPVCGCDRVSYGNECDAAAGGTSVDTLGRCPCGSGVCPLGHGCCNPLMATCTLPGQPCLL